MTCNDCIHQTACFDWCRGFGQKDEVLISIDDLKNKLRYCELLVMTR